MNYFDQAPYEIKMEWGMRGAREAANRNEIIIIVDVLSFSSTVTAALQHEAIIYPFPPPLNEEARKYAETLGAELVVGRAEAIKTRKHSLSPVSFSSSDNGKSYVLCSLNGAACVEAAKKVPALFIGSLLNAHSVAETAMSIKNKTGKSITVIACGERWAYPFSNENELRPCIEDYLGAGAILSTLQGAFSPEALVCKRSFQASKEELDSLIKNGGSGRELAERGFQEDVLFCSQYNKSSVVPILSDNRFIPYQHSLKI